jgi:hypothetical protein
MESILHGIKPEPSKQSLVNDREQSMKELKRKDKLHLEIINNVSMIYSM